MKRLLYKIVIPAFLFLFSCAGNKMSVHYLEMSTFEPAKITFAPDVVNIVVVNNMPDAVVEPFFFEKKPTEKFQIEEQDTVFVNLSQYLAPMMDEKRYFNSVKMYPNRMRGGDYDKNVHLLTDDQVVDICEAMDADVLISIDKFTIDEKKVPDITPMSFQSIEFHSYCQASIFYSTGEMFPQGIVMRDTLNISVPRADKEDRTQSGDGSRKNLRLLVMDKLTNYVIPAIKAEERWFYSYENATVRLAETAAGAGDWTTAKQFWSEALGEEQSTLLKARLAFNIALANECLDDLDGAAEYLKIAAEHSRGFGSNLLKQDVKRYQVMLDKRKGYFDDLQEQLGNPYTSEENKR